MKKVIVIVSPQTTQEQMESIRDSILDPGKKCVVISEYIAKQVINIEFDEVGVQREEHTITMVVDSLCGQDEIEVKPRKTFQERLKEEFERRKR